MRGSIVSQQKCPLCGRVGAYSMRDFGKGRLALLCRCGQFISDHPEIRISWQGRVHRFNRDKLGRRFRTYVDAERSLGQINEEIENALDPARRGPAFNPKAWSGRGRALLWETYLDAYLKREQARCTLATYYKKAAMARHLSWFNGRGLRTIRAGDLMDFEALPCLRLALAPKTRADLMQLLRHIFRQAVLREDLERVPPVPRVEVPRPPIRWMNQKQQGLALQHIPAPHRPIFLFLFEYGARVSEACGLCWDCLDLANRIFYIARTWSPPSRSGNGTCLKPTTKGKRATALPMMPWFEEYLESGPQGIGQTPVFRNPNACPRRNPASFYMPESLGAIWRKALASAGLEHIPLKNGTRHSVGNQKLREGWPVDLVARLLTHASTRPTESFYVESDAEILREKMGVGKLLRLGISPEPN